MVEELSPGLGKGLFQLQVGMFTQVTCYKSRLCPHFITKLDWSPCVKNILYAGGGGTRL